MPGNQRNIILPYDADKILFAEDFVNHILLKLKLPLLSSGIANHRAQIYNAFTPQVKLGANYIYSVFEEDLTEQFNEILKKYTINIHAFLKYVMSLKFSINTFSTEFEARSLMHFCVKISTMAGKFCMHGYFNAVCLSVKLISNLLSTTDMTRGGWATLNTVAAKYAQCFIDMDNYLTPESASDYEFENISLSSFSSSNSDSPDHQMEGGDGQDEHPEELDDDDYCNMCIDALRSSSDESVPSSSNSKHVEETDYVKADNIASSSDSTSDSLSSGSSKEKSSVDSFHLFESTSRADESSKQVQKWQNDKPSCSYSREFKNDTNLCETDLKTAGPFGTQLTEKCTAVSNSPVKELHKSDSSLSYKTSNSGNVIKDMNAGLMEEGDSSTNPVKLSPVKKIPVPKRRK